MAAGTFPATISTTPPQASAKLGNNAANAGQTNAIPLDRLTFLEEVVGNMLTDLPTGITLPSTYVAGVGGAGAALATQVVTKRVSAITENTATTIITLTVPNVLASGRVEITIVAIAGASGAIGAGECVTSATYAFSFARTPGVAVGALISTVWGSSAAVVVGAGTMTAVIPALTLTGEGVTATNTVLAKVTIDASATADAHTCLVYARCFNSLAGGGTIA